MDMDTGWWILMFRLKDRPMAVQIWTILGLVLGLSFALNTILFPIVLRNSFTNETYARIEEAQDYILQHEKIKVLIDRNNLSLQVEYDKNALNKYEGKPPFRIVRHLLLLNMSVNGELPSEIIKQMYGEAEQQQEELRHYNKKIDNKEIFYVIRKTQLDGENVYLASYLWEKYRDNLVGVIFKRLIGILIFILIISWIASIAIARYLTRPLVQLESKVKDIAVRKWETPVTLDREDELGKLGKAIDWMRLQLLEQDRKQQSFLQQVSHDLKTPIMVIRSYVQSITDGIFPCGDMKNSLKVIEEETERLEKRVRFLLNYTKYEYLAKHQLEETVFDLAELIRKTSSNIMWRNSNIKWKIITEPTIIKGDKEKIRIVLENILDNQIRYARRKISIQLLNKTEQVDKILCRDFEKYTTKEEGEEKNTLKNYSCLLKIWNDGPEIEGDIMGNIFKKYKKGFEGSFGLGLAIVKLIIELHKGLVWVKNEDKGAAFYIVV